MLDSNWFLFFFFSSFCRFASHCGGCRSYQTVGVGSSGFYFLLCRESLDGQLSLL